MMEKVQELEAKYTAMMAADMAKFAQEVSTGILFSPMEMGSSISVNIKLPENLLDKFVGR